MPSSSSRSRVPARRSPRPAPRVPEPPAGERPLLVPIAAVFGVLVAAENAYLARLLWTPEVGWDWFMVVPILLALMALAGAVGILRGRRLGRPFLAVSAALSLLVLLALVVLFALLGGGRAMWAALLLLVGPLGALILALRRPVRGWSHDGRGSRSPGGRRTPRSGG
jgi:uncharacterized membrane protein